MAGFKKDSWQPEHGFKAIRFLQAKKTGGFAHWGRWAAPDGVGLLSAHRLLPGLSCLFTLNLLQPALRAMPVCEGRNSSLWALGTGAKTPSSRSDPTLRVNQS